MKLFVNLTINKLYHVPGLDFSSTILDRINQLRQFY